ncbi:hypothetical protein JW823_00495 [bacterium]|nr:hypothetical protein [candidate division CSSED10-310 bacterium]
MKPIQLLLTGFESFQKHHPNPSECVIRRMSATNHSGFRIMGMVLPVSYSGCLNFCNSFSDWNRFDAIIMCGLNARVDAVCLEQQALNRQQSDHPDNIGRIGQGEPVLSGSPELIESSVDVVRLAEQVSTPDRPVKASFFAGTYVCNTLYYHVLRIVNPLSIPAVFVHIPTVSPMWDFDSIQNVLLSIGKLISRKTNFPQNSLSQIHSMDDVRTFLYGFINYERKTGLAYTETNYSLDRFESYLGHQNNPHRSGRYIHIAGTKGKGCVSALIASILSAHGLRIGLYTSPHLVDLRERIRFNGKAISEKHFIRLADEQHRIAGRTQSLERAYRTTFEMLTSMAFQYFDRMRTDWSVLETGMGGRLDCTNVVKPDVCAITRIDMDHMDSLGKSLMAIASEKAGIIKNDIPVILGRQRQSVTRFLNMYASNVKAPAFNASSCIRLKNIRMESSGTAFSARIAKRWYHNLRIHLPGRFQFENCRLALAVIQHLAEKKLITLDNDSLLKGLAQTTWPGRFSVIPPSRIPDGMPGKNLIIDGAHNPRAIQALMESIRLLYPGIPLITIFGCSANKNAKGMLRILSRYTSRIVMTSFPNSRALPTDQLTHLARSKFAQIFEAMDVFDAVNRLKQCIMPDDIVLVTGSLFLAGEWMEKIGMSESCLDIY